MLKELWHAFGILMRQLGRVQARLLLFSTYFLVVPPLSLLAWLVVDPLRLSPRHASGSSWAPLEHPPRSLSDLKRQF